MNEIQRIRWDVAYNRNGDAELPRAVMNCLRTHCADDLTCAVAQQVLAGEPDIGDRLNATERDIGVRLNETEQDIGDRLNLLNEARTYRVRVVESPKPRKESDQP
ncbi:MAG: hypothetical protein ACSLE6_11095 [Mycobacterium sp.]